MEKEKENKEKVFQSTSKPASFKASRHFPIVLISGSPLPISISAYGTQTLSIQVYKIRGNGGQNRQDNLYSLVILVIGIERVGQTPFISSKMLARLKYSVDLLEAAILPEGKQQSVQKNHCSSHKLQKCDNDLPHLVHDKWLRLHILHQMYYPQTAFS